jgi:hypothetical protein
MGGDFGYNWDTNDFCHYSTRHMSKALLKRLKVLATRTDNSVEYLLNRALDLGVTQLERKQR